MVQYFISVFVWMKSIRKGILILENYFKKPLPGILHKKKELKGI